MRTCWRYTGSILRWALIGLSLSLWPRAVMAQGWEFIGPDSSNWRSVEKLSTMWRTSDRMVMAAVTSRGIAISEENGAWTYPLANVDGSLWYEGHTYADIAFLPSQPDSVLIEFDRWCTEVCPEIRKASYPEFYGMWPPLATPNCWFGGGRFLVGDGEDPVVYLGLCSLQRSDDLGRTWAPVGADSGLWYPNFKLLSLDRSSNSTILATSSPNSLVRYTQKGTTKKTVFVLNGWRDITDAIALGDTILLSVAAWNDPPEDRGIHRSTDGGQSWVHVFNECDVHVLEWSKPPEDVVFAAGTDGIFRSTDYGATWWAFNTGLPTRLVSDIQATSSPDTIIAAAPDQGIFKFWQFLLEIKENLHPPSHFALEQNYPNPFNPSTTINYELPRASHVTLTVYDLLGREVATLVDGLEEPGYKSVEWNAAGVASGIYLCRLDAGDFVQSRKLLLLH
jgi:hypothetical protein